MAIPLPPKVYLACGITDMRNGIDGLLALVEEKMDVSILDQAVFVFRGRRADRVKLLWWDGQGMCLFYKRLENGRFMWPVTQNGTARLTKAQLSMLLEGIDWRRPVWTDTLNDRPNIIEAACWAHVRRKFYEDHKIQNHLILMRY